MRPAVKIGTRKCPISASGPTTRNQFILLRNSIQQCDIRLTYGRPRPAFYRRRCRNKTSSLKRTTKKSLFFLRSRQNKKLPDRRHHNARTEPSRSDRIELLVMWRSGHEPDSSIPPFAGVLLFSGLRFCKLPTERLRSVLADCANNSARSGGAFLRPALHHSKIRTMHHPGIRSKFEYPRPFLPLSNTLSNC